MVFGRFEMLHTTPNGKVPVKEKEKWTIPLCIINSENADDYVVPLKNRLAAGGRGLPEVIKFQELKVIWSNCFIRLKGAYSGRNVRLSGKI